MSTTTLFVELLVTGFGALIWVVLVVLCFVKGGELSPLAKPSWIALPLIAVAYVLGVVTDRLADKVADWLGEHRFLKECFPDRSAYFRAHSEIFARSQGLAAILQYSRSRLRVCRGWAFNCPLIALASLAYIYAHRDTIENASLAAIVVGIALSVATLTLWYSWRKIARSEYMKVKMHADYLQRERSGAPGDSAV
jgi:hypothetical protein